MRPRSIAAVAALGAGALAACSGGGAPAGPAGGAEELATVHCDEPTREFGAVWEGSVLRHEFRFRVAGDVPLVVRAARTDCGCTRPELFAVGAGGARAPYELGAPLEPGAELLLGVSYATRGRRGDVPRSIRLFANVPGGVLEAVLAAEVRPWLVADPESQTLRRMGLDESREATIRVRAQEPCRLVHSGQGLPPGVEVEVRPEAPDAGGRSRDWVVRAVLGPGLPRGSHTYPIHLHSDVPNPDAYDDGEGEPLTFRASPFVGVQVSGELTFSPPNLAFGAVPPGGVVSRTLRVACHDPAFRLPAPAARLELVQDAGDLPLVEAATVRAVPVPGQNAWDVELALSDLPPGPARGFVARLVVETGHPREPRLEVPVSGFRGVPDGGGR